jgi:PAS domain S-box-containing protein
MSQKLDPNRPPSPTPAKRSRPSAPSGRRVGGAQRLQTDTENDFRGMFEHAVWGIFRSTADGKYIRANSAMADLYGYPSPEALMTEVTDIGRQIYIDPGRRDAFVHLMRENGGLTGFESQIRRRDGAVIWVSESCREVRDAHGALLFYEGSVEDISARKQVEAELVAARAQAEHYNKAKSIFLAHMSHELRTPLNAILGFSELIGRELFGPLGDKRYLEFAADILRSGQYLLSIIDNILDLAKVEAGQFALEEREIDLAEVMRASERLVAEAARRRNVVFDMQSPGSLVMLQADPTRLRQILINLLSNAVKFTPEGKSVTLSCGRQGDWLAIKVVDTGIGMDANEIAEVMQPFHQVDNSLSRRYEGAGLGLPVTQSLVDLHGGELEIESARGVGTTVTVRLPAARVLDWGSLA